MLGSWLLLLLMLPGWLLPSGLRFSTCTCAERTAEVSACCVVEAAPPCCAARSHPDDSRTDRRAPRAESGPVCGCFVATPDHEGDRALHVAVYASELFDAARFESPIVWKATRAALKRVDPHRARGPSPGGTIPLPLRL